MNLVEHKILEVHDVIPHERFGNLVNVDLTYDCYGAVRRVMMTFNKDVWERVQKEGVFLA